jgi:hypothetical protein
VDNLSAGSAGVQVRDPGLPEQAPAVAPMYGSVVRSQRPTLSWKAPQGAASYRVELLSSAKERIWMVDSKTAELPFPKEQKALEKGHTYHWTVTAILKDGTKKPVATRKFLTASADDEEDLKPIQALVRGDDPADLFLAASVYQWLRMYDDALQVYQRLAKRFPDEPFWHAALADYYEPGGRAHDAQEELAKAVRLGYTPPRRDQ